MCVVLLMCASLLDLHVHVLKPTMYICTCTLYVHVHAGCGATAMEWCGGVAEGHLGHDGHGLVHGLESGGAGFRSCHSDDHL